MKSRRQILEWLDKRVWKDKFYENHFRYGTKDIKYNEDFILSAFPWNETEQGSMYWKQVDKEYFNWYRSNSKPMSWEEYCEQNPIREDEYYINGNGMITHSFPGDRNAIRDANAMSKDLCEAFLAYMKLIQLRNAWVKDCDNVNMNYRIMASNCKIDILYCCIPKTGLSFPTQEMAAGFQDIFKDLLEIAKPVL